MGWAAPYIAKLKAGETVTFRPRGNSMTGKVDSGQLVTVSPADGQHVEKGDIVLCKVNGNEYLHLVSAVASGGRQFQISNNRGYVNGWTSRDKIYGICTKVED
jgi:SOS-response transcriptional repressor LexA